MEIKKESMHPWLLEYTESSDGEAALNLLVRRLRDIADGLWGYVLKDVTWAEPLRKYIERAEDFPPVWAGNAWADKYLWHCVAVSEEDPAQIAYFQSIEKMERGIRTKTRPGRYLTKYYSDVLDEGQIRELAEKYAASGCLLPMKTLSNDTWDGSEDSLQHEWERLYNEISVDYSCMAGKKAPRAYGLKGNGLGLAFFELPDGSLAGRSIVRLDRKEFIRVYPHGSSGLTIPVIENLLKDAGFSEGDLGGIKLARIKDYGQLLCPYLDGDVTGVDDYGDHLRITDGGEYEADASDGLLEVRELCVCCGERTDSDDMNDTEDGRVCDYCYGQRYVEALSRHGHTVVIHRNNATYCEFNDTYYTEAGAYERLFTCEEDGDLYPDEEGVETSRGTVYRGNAVYLDEMDDDGNRWAVERDTQRLPDGRLVHDNVYDELLAEYEADQAEEESKGEEACVNA